MDETESDVQPSALAAGQRPRGPLLEVVEVELRAHPLDSGGNVRRGHAVQLGLQRELLAHGRPGLGAARRAYDLVESGIGDYCVKEG